MHQGNTCREINQVLIKSNTEKESEKLNNGSQNENEDSSNDRFTESRNSGT